ncbi:MAG TPA: alpha/beta hydrolase [Leptospiraceae bacterium]|nr:alpha/beta hydrolase [Leptospiraceae bacterium]
MNPLDDETLASRVFFPRKSAGRAPAGARDLMIPVARAELGARFYEKDPAFRTVLYFHGNGETVPDYDRIAGLYHRSRLNLFVVDYRGYGFSTGSRPTLRSLSEDPPIVSEFFLKQIRPAAPLPIIMGRSLGSSPATDIAVSNPQRYAGLILESGFADVRPLLGLLGVQLSDAQEEGAHKLFSNAGKLSGIKIPVLILHGEEDHLIPAKHARANFEAAAVKMKTLKIMQGAGHNDLLVQSDEYFSSIDQFVQKL